MKTKTKWTLALLGGVALSAAVFEGFRRGGQRLFEQAFSIRRRPVDPDCWLAKASYEMLHIQSHDGLQLTGYYVAKDKPDFTMVIIHGYHGHAFRMSEYAKAFYEKFNCDLFLPDLRGHGQSEGNLVGYGWLDKDDIKQWVELLHQRHPLRPIVLFGLSMGGGTVNFLADQKMPGVKVLIEDCGYSTLYQELDFQCRQETKLPFFPFYYGANEQVKKYGGYRITDADGLKAVSHARYPMLFIHGLNDDVVPSRMVFDLYNACSSEKQLFFVKETGHADALKNSAESYLDTMNEFLQEHLK